MSTSDSTTRAGRTVGSHLTSRYRPLEKSTRPLRSNGSTCSADSSTSTAGLPNRLVSAPGYPWALKVQSRHGRCLTPSSPQDSGVPVLRFRGARLRGRDRGPGPRPKTINPATSDSPSARTSPPRRSLQVLLSVSPGLPRSRAAASSPEPSRQSSTTSSSVPNSGPRRHKRRGRAQRMHGPTESGPTWPERRLTLLWRDFGERAWPRARAYRWPLGAP